MQLNESVLDCGDFKVTFRNTIATSMRFQRLLDTWANNDKADDAAMRSRFAFIVSHISEWEGDMWSPPSSNNVRALEKAYENFINTFSYAQSNDMAETINALYEPVASNDEKLDSLLTEEEASDPN